MEQVVLVDEADNEIGVMEKIEAHRKGVLHRAFSILLFNSKGEVLIQKRSLEKYHSAGLWSNTCCSHPLPHETMETATQRKLKQEMGIDLKTDFAYKFIYRAELNNLIEHELDHVFVGKFEGTPNINSDEVAGWKWVHWEELKNQVKTKPNEFTFWFKKMMEQRLQDYL
ncbi:MAG: Isopentenyl-diphosphate Delta-isomerase [Cytophagales bacterium]|jgi:isopentenyl-diphosphate delta-isomerase|nr:isopentenyl-diphosphate Delta-isomerase [Bacteroidota bacterium]MBS1980932.1 isopentenyl-diphosphate Delta-isomerase [Bacteroidota bacterium]WHZ08285.1 MAG: Isopentenyl-diphosphate Delta-isomerase [Cytophagales bacterium]